MLYYVCEDCQRVVSPLVDEDENIFFCPICGSYAISCEEE